MDLSKTILAISIFQVVCGQIDVNFDCVSDENCRCIRHFNEGIIETSFSCSKDEGMIEVLIGIEYINTLIITCKSLTKLEEDIFPDVDLSLVIDTVEILNCPLPDNGYEKLFERMNATVKTLMNIKGIQSDIFEFTSSYFSIYFRNLTKLSIQDSKMNCLREDSFINFDNLTYLIVKNNHINEIHGNSFEKMQFLTMLDLSLNNIDKLKENIFQELVYLETLNLEHNKLTIIDEDIFRKLKSLKNLYLNNNQIGIITDYAFQYSKNLLDLNLAFNKLTSIRRDHFKGLEELKKLELENNLILNIDNESFHDLLNLEYIFLRDNNIKFIGKEVFQYNVKLEAILLQRNRDLIMDDEIFSKLINLKQLDISNCSFLKLPKNIIKNSSNIKELAFELNKIQVVDEDLFYNSSQLGYLYMGFNLIEELPISLFKAQTKLVILELQNNRIRHLDKDIFTHLTNLDDLDLSSNLLEELDDLLFNNTKSLRFLKLQNNLITTINNRVFLNMENIFRIDLSQNKITKLHPFAVSKIKHLNKFNMSHNLFNGLNQNTLYFPRKIDTVDFSYNLLTNIPVLVAGFKIKLFNLSHNCITTIDEFRFDGRIRTKLTFDLSNNKIATIDFTLVRRSTWNATLFAIMTNNPIVCDCFNFDFVTFLRNENDPLKEFLKVDYESLTCASPSENAGIDVSTLDFNLLMCPLDIVSETCFCPQKCRCYWRPSDNYSVIDCSAQFLTDIPLFDVPETVNFKNNTREVKAIELNMGHNLLTNVREIINRNVTILNLSQNNLNQLSWIPKNIKVLHLDNNNLRTLSKDIVAKLLYSSTLKHLSLHGNPWECECETVTFQDFLFKMEKQVNLTAVLCESTGLPIIHNLDLCSARNMKYIALGSSFIFLLLITSLLITLYFKYKLEIKVWLFSRNLCLWYVMEEELDGNKKYDVFISYSHKDEPYVLNTLLPILEEEPHPYSVTFHHRHFVPGEFIATNIINSVQQSRRTLVVLSNDFLDSIWGKLEFRTAHTQALSDGLSRVILVIHGDLDQDHLDDELKAYIKTNTYIKWDDSMFRNKLQYALPHAKFRGQMYDNLAHNIEMNSM